MLARYAYRLRNHSPLDATVLTPDGGVIVGQCRADGERIVVCLNELLQDLDTIKKATKPGTNCNRIPIRNAVVRQMFDLPASVPALAE